MANNDDTIRDFLASFYGEIPDGERFCLWRAKGKRHTWCDTIEFGAKAGGNHSEEDTYFSMGLYPGSISRRTKDNVSCIFGVWLDIDVGDKDNGKTYFPTMEEAIEWVYDALAGMWTHVVHSGGGLHVYLMFDEPLWLTEEQTRFDAEMAVKAYHRWADSQCPYDIDPIIDLSRIMRLPGTMNKRAGERCHLIDTCKTETSVSDLLQKLPTVSLTGSGHLAGTDGDVDLGSLKQRIALMCEADQTFDKTWRRMRRFPDKSPSGYCMSLANQLCSAGLSNAEVYAALKTWRTGQADAKDKPDTWYQTCIGKAREAAGPEREEIALNTKLDLSLTEEDEEQQTDTVTHIFGAPFKRMVKKVTEEYRGHKEKASYVLEFVDASVIVPSTGTLLNQTAMRELLYEELSLLMKRMKAPQYDKAILVLQKLTEEERVDLEGNMAFAIEEELRTFVHAKKEQMETTEHWTNYNRGMLFEDEDGALYFNWSAFKIRLEGVRIKVNNKELAKILRLLGSAPKQFNDNDRTRLWSIPEGL